jgi:hypothetical protein
MTPRAVRKAERIVHLCWGLLIALYVYDLLPASGEPVLRWVAVPGIVGSGVAMWFAAPLRRLVARFSSRVLGRPSPRTRTDPSTAPTDGRRSPRTPLATGTVEPTSEARAEPLLEDPA